MTGTEDALEGNKPGAICQDQILEDLTYWAEELDFRVEEQLMGNKLSKIS